MTRAAGLTRPVGPSKDCTWLLQPHNCCGLASLTLSYIYGLFKRQIWTKHREFYYEYMLLHTSSPMGAQMVSGWTEGTANMMWPA